jgi:hypothetical protein
MIHAMTDVQYIVDPEICSEERNSSTCTDEWRMYKLQPLLYNVR